VSKVYYSRWLHTGREIRVADSGKAAIVQGIHEETGELLAEDPETREVIALSPGDNSFDILTGMVSRKLK
jgi:biotin-(acetyl-CoA carboxylase) ligase